MHAQNVNGNSGNIITTMIVRAPSKKKLMHAMDI